MCPACICSSGFAWLVLIHAAVSATELRCLAGVLTGGLPGARALAALLALHHRKLGRSQGGAQYWWDAAPACSQAMRLKNPQPPCCQVLRFSFALPPRGRMAELSKLMSAAMHFVDAVGTYKLKPEQRQRAEKLRKDVAAVEWRKQDDRRREEAEERRAAKKREELVRFPVLNDCLPCKRSCVHTC